MLKKKSVYFKDGASLFIWVVLGFLSWSVAKDCNAKCSAHKVGIEMKHLLANCSPHNTTEMKHFSPKGYGIFGLRIPQQVLKHSCDEPHYVPVDLVTGKNPLYLKLCKNAKSDSRFHNVTVLLLNDVKFHRTFDITAVTELKTFLLHCMRSRPGESCVRTRNEEDQDEGCGLIAINMGFRLCFGRSAGINYGYMMGELLSYRELYMFYQILLTLF